MVSRKIAYRCEWRLSCLKRPLGLLAQGLPCADSGPPDLTPERRGSILKSHSWPRPWMAAGQVADIRAGFQPIPAIGSRQLGEQCFGILQIGGIESLAEPTVNGRQKIACFSPPSLLAPQPREARRRAQFKRFRLLMSRNAE